MNHKTKLLLNIFMGLIVIAMTLLIFFLGFSKQPKIFIDYISLIFIIFSEVILFGGMILVLYNGAKVNKIIMRAGVISTLFLYWIFTILTSVFFKLMFNDNVSTFVIIQFMAIAIVAIIIISLVIFASQVERSNSRAMDSRVWMQESESIILSLKLDSKLTPYMNILDQLYEELKYSDKVALNLDRDMEINRKINDFSEDIKEMNISSLTEQYVEDKIRRIIFLVKERNMLMKQAKRGSV